MMVYYLIMDPPHKQPADDPPSVDVDVGHDDGILMLIKVAKY